MKQEPSRYLTFMIMPETSAIEVRRYRVHKRWLAAGVGAVGAMTLAFVLSVAYNWQLRHASHALGQLEFEKSEILGRVAVLDDQLRGMDKVVDDLRTFDARLRALTLVSDPDRELAIGPVGQAAGTPGLDLDERGEDLRRDLVGRDAKAWLGLVEGRLSGAEKDALQVKRRAQSLSIYLEGQKSVLASTPSRRPTHGYISSDFGMRMDPFTGLPQMHRGMDFSAHVGAKVVATADGTVTHVGRQGAYGESIQVHHGHGLVSRYAHLSKSYVKLGDRVKRGQTIGAVGNTGRSTGPHLHYEIRVNGIAQNPRRYLLE